MTIPHTAIRKHADEGPLVVLVHGAGHTSSVWTDTQAAMSAPTLAVNMPGRADRPAELVSVTPSKAASSIARDIEAATASDLVLVGHSVGAIVLPLVAAELLSRVRHLVFVAGITVADGHIPIDQYLPERASAARAALSQLREDHAGATLEELDARTSSSIDSINLSSHAMQWSAIPPSLPRTYIRCLRDPIQPSWMQDLFIQGCQANDVLEVDAGHTPALDAPTELGRLLDTIASQYSDV